MSWPSRRARRQGGYGRDFAAWAIALSVAAVPICVAGFFLTRYIVEQIERYDDPGDFTITHGTAPSPTGRSTFDGTITNEESGTRSYELTIVYTTGLAEVGRRYLDVDDVGPGASRSWTTTDTLNTVSTEVTATSPTSTGRRRSACAPPTDLNAAVVVAASQASYIRA